jgi:hypothetical protein
MRRRQPRPALALVLALAGALAGCAGVTRADSLLTTAPNGAVERIPLTVTRPPGTGPFPAVVIMHDCSGLGPSSSHAPERWTAELVRRGYVVLVPDSFTTRGFPGGVCSDPSPGRVDVAPPRRTRDAYAALAHARSLPEVDGKRVGLMGGSHGASTTLVSMVAAQSAIEPLAANPVRYAAARMNANSPTGRGATTGGNPEAWADSIREVAAFFGRHLGGATTAAVR